MVNTLNPPAEVIASWPAPNYVDPDTRGSGLLVLSIFLMVLGFATISLRTYSRVLITRAFGADDGLIICSYLFSVSLSSLVIVGNLDYYSGRHVWDVPPATFIPHRKNIWWSELIYVFAACTVKISVLLFYRRLSVSFTRTFLWATWVGISINIVYMIAFVLALLLICRPLDAYWNSFNPLWVKTHKYSCGAENFSLPFSAGISVLTDLYATIVPMILILSMKKSIKEKAALYSLFSFGFIVVFFGIMRTVYSYRILNVTYDFTHTLYTCWIWTQLELYTALLAASAPALRPLFRHAIFLMRSDKDSRPSFIPHHAHHHSRAVDERTSAIGSNAQNSRNSAAVTSAKPMVVSHHGENPFEMAENIESASRTASSEIFDRDEQRSHSWLSNDRTFVNVQTPTQEKHVSTSTTVPLTPRSPASPLRASQHIRRRSANLDSSHAAMLASP